MALKKKSKKLKEKFQGGYYIIMVTKKKTKDELIEDILINNVIKCFKEDNKEDALHYLYALKMWRKA